MSYSHLAFTSNLLLISTNSATIFTSKTALPLRSSILNHFSTADSSGHLTGFSDLTLVFFELFPEQSFQNAK